MEKQQSRSPEKSFSVLSSPAHPTIYPTGSAGASTGPNHRANMRAKPSRDDVTRCIRIWASVYRLSDDDIRAADLQVPSHTWLGRIAARLEHLE